MEISSKYKLITRYGHSFCPLVIGTVLGVISFLILTNFGGFLPDYISEYYLWLFFPLFFVKIFFSGLSTNLFFVIVIVYSILLIFPLRYIYEKHIYGKQNRLFKISYFLMLYVVTNFLIIYLTVFAVIQVSGTLSPKTIIDTPASTERPSVK